MQKKGLVASLALRAENAAHNEFVQLVAVQGRVDQGSGFGFEGCEVSLTEGTFADQEERPVFRRELIVNSGGGEGDGFGGLWDNVQGEGGGVVAVPLRLQEFPGPEGFDRALHGGEGEVTEPREIVVAHAGDEIVRFVPQAQVDALFRRGKIRHHPGHKLRELLVVHCCLLLSETR